MERKLELERLRTLLSYDPDTGIFTWKADIGNHRFVGEEAGVVAKNGRRYIALDGVTYLAHQLAWFYVNGVWANENIAPINGDYLDLRISNLKEESAAETARRGGVTRSAKRSVPRGVSWATGRQKWIASGYRNYKRIHLGYFESQESAAAAVEKWDAENPTADVGPVLADKTFTDQKRRDYVARALWRKVCRANPVVGWSSQEEFSREVGEAPDRKHMLAAIDNSRPIGPKNWVWQRRGIVDYTDKAQVSAQNKAYRAANQHLVRDQMYRSKFGITLTEYESKLASQNGVCAICGRPETGTRHGKVKALAVDHDHATNEVRDLLCGKCNPMIGYAEDNIEILQNAINYLRRHKKPKVAVG